MLRTQESQEKRETYSYDCYDDFVQWNWKSQTGGENIRKIGGWDIENAKKKKNYQEKW